MLLTINFQFDLKMIKIVCEVGRLTTSHNARCTLSCFDK